MVTVEIDGEIEETIVCASLKKYYKCLHDERFYESMFSLEPYENIVQVHLLRDAMKRVHNYYSIEKLD
jgi:hypothetical protein